MQYEGQTVAVLNLGSHTHYEILFTTRKALEAIAAQTGGADARVSAEEALKESKRDLHGLFDTNDDFLFILDSLLRDRAELTTPPSYWHRLCIPK